MCYHVPVSRHILFDPLELDSKPSRGGIEDLQDLQTQHHRDLTETCNLPLPRFQPFSLPVLHN